MTFKKKVISAPAPLAPAPAPLPIDDVPVLKKSTTCGHVNKQYINADGKREDLPCVLSPGHVGDHEADYLCLRLVDGSIAQARLIAAGKVVLKIGGIERIEVTERAYWSDAAGVLAVNVAPDAEQLADIKARKGEFIDAAVLKKPVP